MPLQQQQQQQQRQQFDGLQNGVSGFRSTASTPPFTPSPINNAPKVPPNSPTTPSLLFSNPSAPNLINLTSTTGITTRVPPENLVVMDHANWRQTSTSGHHHQQPRAAAAVGNSNTHYDPSTGNASYQNQLESSRQPRGPVVQQYTPHPQQQQPRYAPQLPGNYHPHHSQTSHSHSRRDDLLQTSRSAPKLNEDGLWNQQQQQQQQQSHPYHRTATASTSRPQQPHQQINNSEISYNNSQHRVSSEGVPIENDFRDHEKTMERMKRNGSGNSIGQQQQQRSSNRESRHCNPPPSYPAEGLPSASSRRSLGMGIDSRVFTNEDIRSQFFDSLPNVLLTGLPRAGKTSISEVVYRKSSPHETLFMQQTPSLQILRVANTNLVQFNLVDCPGLLFQDSSIDGILFPNAKSLIFVIDAQNEPYGAEIAHCKDLFKRAWKWNPQINFEVFIHKVDGDFFSVDEVRAECQRDIHDKLMNYLHEGGVAANVVFYSTSIYDQTIFEACSRVIQRLIPHIATLERLLDLLVASCKMEKAFLIDVLSKTFIATDSSPFDPFNYELCTDMVDVVIEISCIYGDVQPHEHELEDNDDGIGSTIEESTTTEESTTNNNIEEGHADDHETSNSENGNQLGSVVNNGHSTTSGGRSRTYSSFAMHSEPSSSNIRSSRRSSADNEQELLISNEDVLLNTHDSSVVSNGVHDESSSSSSNSNGVTSDDDTQGSTLCLIQLNNGHILYLREVDRLLALACVVREEHFDRQYLVDHNIRVFRDAMLEFFQRH